MKKIIVLMALVACVSGSLHAQNLTQQVTALQYFYNTDPGVGLAYAHKCIGYSTGNGLGGEK